MVSGSSVSKSAKQLLKKKKKRPAAGASSEEIDSSALMSNLGSGLDINENGFDAAPKSQNSITSPHIEDQAASATPVNPYNGQPENE